MRKKEKPIFIYIAFTVGLLVLVTQLEFVVRLLGYVADLFKPIFVGLIIAFVLNVPVTGI